IVPRLGSLLRPEHTSFPFEARQSRRSRSTSAARSPLSALSESPAACYTLPRGQKSLGQTRLQLPAVLYPCPHDPGSVGRDPQHVPPEEDSLRRAFQVWLEEYIYPKLKIRPEDLPK